MSTFRPPVAAAFYPERGLHGRAVEELGLRIVRGDFATGAVLDLVQLAASYDASRSGIREVLRVLAGKGLIDARPKKGTFILDRSRWNLLDPDMLRWQLATLPNRELLEKLAELRLMVEPAAASLAAGRRSAADLDELAAALAMMDVDDEDQNATRSIVTGDIRFHRAVIAATNNELIERFAHVIEIALRSRDEYVHTNHISIKNGWRGHEAVFAAIRDGLPDQARLAMLELVEAAAADAREAVVRDSARGLADDGARTPTRSLT